MEANQYLNDFYNHYDEDSRLLFQHGSVEFLTTMRYICLLYTSIITLLRKEKGVTQKQAAEDLGVSQALLSHSEKGIRECGLEFVVRVADYYGVSCEGVYKRQPWNAAARPGFPRCATIFCANLPPPTRPFPGFRRWWRFR